MGFINISTKFKSILIFNEKSFFLISSYHKFEKMHNDNFSLKIHVGNEQSKPVLVKNIEIQCIFSIN